MSKYFHKTPFWMKWLYPGFVWNYPRNEKNIYLTFDDGPTPELTSFILDTLDTFQSKATFFCVGENLKDHPRLATEMTDRGHRLANHTFNHLNGWKAGLERYVENTNMCSHYVGRSQGRLFRPPYGKITRKQASELKKRGYEIVMWDVLSGDFDPELSPEDCLKNTIKATRPGSIVVFHDNIKAEERIKYVLPRYLEFLSNEGYIASLC